MDVHLIDGTYELFRQYYGGRARTPVDGEERGAVIGVVRSVVRLLASGVTHVGVATDHVVESFRNELWPGYKTGEGIDPDLWAQFHPLEDALVALGIVVWPCVEVEADDALASAAHRAAEDSRVDRVVIRTPDKDLAQSVRDERVVQLDVRSGDVRDRAGVEAKFGVPPESIADYLALTGDAADGFPGLPGWGATSSSRVLARYGRLEDIPADPASWDVDVRGKARLAATLTEHRGDALLFRRLAVLRTDVDVFDDVDALRWRGPTPGFADLAASWGEPALTGEVAAIPIAPA